MSEIGNRLLYSISVSSSLSSTRFSQIFAGLYGQLRDHENIATPIAVVRSRALRVLDQLGHVDVLVGPDGGVAAIYPADPSMTRLPVAGVPRFVLTGRRSPDMVEKLRDSLRSFRSSAEVFVKGTGSSVFNSPDSIELRCDEVQTARLICDRLHIALEAAPSAWGLLKFSPSLDEYAERLVWVKEKELPWKRVDFSSESYQYVARSEEDAVGLRLSRYSDGSGFRFRSYLRKGDERAAVSPDWGKHMVLHQLGVNPISFDDRSGNLTVPFGVGFPRYIARALTLCSGVPGVVAGDAVITSSRDRGVPSLTYRDVPRDICDEVMKKLGCF